MGIIESEESMRRAQEILIAGGLPKGSKDLGIVPRPMEAVLPSYLWRFSQNGQFDRQTA